MSKTQLTERQQRNQDAFVDGVLALRDPESEAFKEIAFWGRLFVQAALPHSNPGRDVDVWGRENGRFSLTVQSGADVVNGKTVYTGIPFGSIPRLLLSWMCTEVVRTREQKIYLGDSLAEFMRSIGIGDATGGRWGSITRLKNQMRRLFEARISYRWRGEEGEARKSIQVADEEVLWWSDEAPSQSGLFQSYVLLSDAFFEDIITRPVPVKLAALKLLKQSPLALDLYTWLTYRVFALKKPVAISWVALGNQLGAEYSDPKNFARACRQHLRTIRTVYPEFRVAEERGRLIVKPSMSHVVAVPRVAGSRAKSAA